jgi:hypothetical protein
MSKSISPDLFIANALYYVKSKPVPLSLDPKDRKYFWRYTFLASEKIRKEFKDIFLYSDKNSLENVIYNKGWYVKIKDNKLGVSHKMKKRDLEEINACLDPDIKKALPKIFREAYDQTQIS